MDGTETGVKWGKYGWGPKNNFTDILRALPNTDTSPTKSQKTNFKEKLHFKLILYTANN